MSLTNLYSASMTYNKERYNACEQKPSKWKSSSTTLWFCIITVTSCHATTAGAEAGERAIRAGADGAHASKVNPHHSFNLDAVWRALARVIVVYIPNMYRHHRYFSCK